METITRTLPVSGIEWEFRDTMTHRVKRQLEKVGRRFAFSTMREVEDAGVDLQKLTAAADRQANAANKDSEVDWGSEQEDFAIIEGTVALTNETGSRVTDEINQHWLDGLAADDTTFMVEELREAWGFRKTPPLVIDVPSEAISSSPESSPEILVGPTG